MQLRKSSWSFCVALKQPSVATMLLEGLEKSVKVTNNLIAINIYI
jgi:hypothetical protein